MLNKKILGTSLAVLVKIARNDKASKKNSFIELKLIKLTISPTDKKRVRIYDETLSEERRQESFAISPSYNNWELGELACPAFLG
jgi:hypothetical protein